MIKNVKILTKSQTANCYQRVNDISRKENQAQLLEATEKYNRFKKSASLPPYYMNQTRLKRITEIYRSLSTEKLHVSSKQNRSPGNTPPKHPSPFTPLNLNSIDQAKTKNRLTIQRGENTPKPQGQLEQSSNTLWGQIVSKLRGFGKRFQELQGIRAEDLFASEMQKCIEEIKGKGRAKMDEVNSCLKAFEECLARKERIRIGQVRREFANTSAQLSNMQVELKKKTIRAMLDQRQIQRQQNSNRELINQLTQLQKKLSKQTKDACFGTQDDYSNSLRSKDNNCLIFANTEVLNLTKEQGERIPNRCSCKCRDQLENKTIKIAQCMRKIQKYSRRQKEMLAVLVLLRGQGIDVEKIYDDVIQRKIQVTEKEESSMLNAVSQAQKKQRKNQKQVKASVKGYSEFDADDSIISSADGLSFNYEQKSLEEDVYTIRREYKCKRQLEPALKQKLKLNFDILYDGQLLDDEDQQYEFESASNPPTI